MFEPVQQPNSVMTKGSLSTLLHAQVADGGVLSLLRDLLADPVDIFIMQ